MFKHTITHVIARFLLIIGILIMGSLFIFHLTPTTPHARASGPISHIVIMVKENRTFDSMFGLFPGANGASTYKDKSGITHPLGHETLSLAHDICHTYTCAKTAEDTGKMDGFSSTGLVQFQSTDIPNYWKLAQTFDMADNNFSQIDANTFGNHIYTVAGSNNNVDSLPVTSSGSATNLWGCDAAKGTTVEERTANNVTTKVFPCFSNVTLADELNAAGVSWKYYAQTTKGASGYQFSTYDAFSQIRNTSQWASHVVPYTQFATDAASGNLPQVSWVTTTVALSDHPPTSICVGENWTVQQLNAVMQGPLWSSTAIALTWDDWGGFYDHVVPIHTGQANNLIETGMRTPLIMISPYAHASTIDHTQFSTVSILKFVENTFGLAALSSEDANATGLDEMLNFNQTPLAPLTLTARTCPASAIPVSGASLTPDD